MERELWADLAPIQRLVGQTVWIERYTRAGLLQRNTEILEVNNKAFKHSFSSANCDSLWCSNGDACLRARVEYAYWYDSSD